MIEFVWCPVCMDETAVETAPCPDGHGDDCAERICTACSTAIFAGPVMTSRVSAA